jgi:adenylyltransferase/sulfurtransferase
LNVNRYHRQQILIGDDPQARLGAAHAVVVGCGALGCVSADLLARAGVGRLTIVDRDVVEITNLQRQTLYCETDVGRAKADAAATRVRAVNSSVDVRAEVIDVDAANVERVCGAGSGMPTVLVDGTDSFETRYLLNDVSVKHDIPYVYAGAVATRAMMMVVAPPLDTACLRCVFADPPAPGTPPTCATAGVLAGATAAIAARQSVEAIKLLTAGPIERGLVEIDVWTGTARRLEIHRRDDCPCCAARYFEYLQGDRNCAAARLCGQNAIQIGAGDRTAPLDLEHLASRLQPHGRFDVDRYMLKGTLDGEKALDGRQLTLTVFHDGREIVGGTHEDCVARGVYARYVGS